MLKDIYNFARTIFCKYISLNKENKINYRRVVRLRWLSGGESSFSIFVLRPAGFGSHSPPRIGRTFWFSIFRHRAPGAGFHSLPRLGRAFQFLIFRCCAPGATFHSLPCNGAGLSRLFDHGANAAEFLSSFTLVLFVTIGYNSRSMLEKNHEYNWSHTFRKLMPVYLCKNTSNISPWDHLTTIMTC